MNKLPEKPPDIIQQPLINSVVEHYFENSEFKNSVDSYNERYLNWDELTYRVGDEEERLRIWAAMKIFRSQKMENTPYSPLKMEYCITPPVQKSLHLFDRYLSGTIQIQNKSLRLDKRYIISSLIEEAISSSILEGAVTTRKEAREMIEQRKKPKNHGEQMVLNNFETLQFIIQKQSESLTPDLLLEIQRVVTKDTIDPEDVDHFRKRNGVRVVDTSTGTVLHTPPNYQEIEEYILNLCKFANTDDDEKFIHPIIKAIIIHFLIRYIHPFNDGNGRTARSLFYWYCLSRGYWLMEYLSISKNILKSRGKYAKAYLYTEYDGFDLTYFIRYQIDCMDDALSDLISYIEGKQEQQKKASEMIRTNPNISPRQAEILSEMMESPNQLFTIFQISDRFNVVYQTARTDLMHLNDLGYIVKEKRGKGLFFYVKEVPKSLSC
ncbi:MAG: Fic family protein [Methanospirillum sp.]|uniref:Fic family protein n=1 Tax=Methanospirillum sp. TaxID=45200 RepID=UPI0023743BAC|nr:Fic family protein [Methanospirillum sp.]MDD1728796.1 Fic family protein [Methanospirillum sp.]